MSTSTSEDEQHRGDVPIRFIQLIRLSLGHNLRLLLPKSFLRRVGHNLGHTVRLTGYDGIICNIQLERTDSDIYLAGGWAGFFDHHNLQDGYALTFAYNGNSSFDVFIFDDSGEEVTYESHSLEDEFSCNGNPIFRVRLEARRNSHRRIDLPGAFARLYLPRPVQSVQIHDQFHHDWVVRTNLRMNGDVRRLTVGWSAFVTAKQLQMGDVCVFELINDTVPRFMVYKVSSIDGSWIWI